MFLVKIILQQNVGVLFWHYIFVFKFSYNRRELIPKERNDNIMLEERLERKIAQEIKCAQVYLEYSEKIGDIESLQGTSKQIDQWKDILDSIALYKQGCLGFFARKRLEKIIRKEEEYAFF